VQIFPLSFFNTAKSLTYHVLDCRKSAVWLQLTSVTDRQTREKATSPAESYRSAKKGYRFLEEKKQYASV